MIMGDDNAGWRARLSIEIGSIDRKSLRVGGATLLVLGAIGVVAGALDAAIAGAASTLASLVLLDAGLGLLAVAWLAPGEASEPSSAEALSATAAEQLVGAHPSGTHAIESESVAAVGKAGSRAARLSAADEKRCRELAVFAGRGPVPGSALQALWSAQGVPSDEVARLTDRLVDRSRVGRLSDGSLIVEENLDESGAVLATASRGLAALHGRLVDGYRAQCPGGSWASGPNDGYFFQNIAYHLARADRAQELNRLLLDYDWLRAKLAVAGIIRLLNDFTCQTNPADVAAVDGALVLSAVSLAVRPDRLAPVLAARLAGVSSPGIDRLLAQMRERAPRPWICPEGQAPASKAKAVQRPKARHDGPVRAVAVTPDGRRLVTGGDDHAIKVWDRASGRLERTLNGHLDSVRAVAITPDGRRIISGGTYDVVRVWDLATGQFQHTIAVQGGFRAVYTLAVTPDGKRAVWGGAGSAVQVWDLARGRAERTFKTQDANVRTVAITPDGKFAVSSGDGGTVQVWDLETGLAVRAMNSRAGAVPAIAITPDGAHVVAAGHDNTVQVWELQSGRLERTIWGHAGAVDALAVTPDGRRAVSGGLDRTVRVWDLSGGGEIARWSPESSAEADPDPRVAAFCPIPTDPEQFACGGSDGSVSVVRLLEA